MNKVLEMVRTMINGANEYEKKTGDKNPPVYFSKDNLLIIEEALLKAQFLEEEYNNLMEDKDNLESELFKQQEPKQYLKWEDLEFKKEEQTMKVLLNGNKYTLDYYSDGYDDYIDFLTDNEQDRIAIYEGGYPHDKQFFNDLHLERVEE